MLPKKGNNAIELLQSMSNLLSLHISRGKYKDKMERLHFEDGWFKNLKELYLGKFYNLSHILIDEGALGSLKKLTLSIIPQLLTLPAGIQHLQKLEVLCLRKMSRKFKQSIAPDKRKEHLIYKQVPSVEIKEF
jgi:disease resistance protein RPM1